MLSADLSLPDSKGLETLAAVRACARLLPIVVLTGADDEQLAIEALQRGAQDYLVKTEINGRVLSRAIRYAVERNTLRARLRLYAAELEEKNQAIEAELKLGRSIQEAYLPAARVNFPSNSSANAESLRFTCRFQPATNLSGDLFEVFELSEKQAGVLICDVMGHGVSAALVSATLHGLVAELRRFTTDPARFWRANCDCTRRCTKRTAISRPRSIWLWTQPRARCATPVPATDAAHRLSADKSVALARGAGPALD